jgi:hypothetical protein
MLEIQTKKKKILNHGAPSLKNVTTSLLNEKKKKSIKRSLTKKNYLTSIVFQNFLLFLQQ